MQALHVVARQVVHVDGLIVSAAAVAMKRNLVMRLQEPFAPLMRILVPMAALVPALDENSLSRNPEVVRLLPAWAASAGAPMHSFALLLRLRRCDQRSSLQAGTPKRPV